MPHLFLSFFFVTPSTSVPLTLIKAVIVSRFNRVTVPKRRRKKGMSVFVLHCCGLPSFFSTPVLICAIFCTVTYPTSCWMKIKPAMKEEMQMENHSWRETAKNMRSFGVAKSKQLLLLSLSLSLKTMLKDLWWLTAHWLFQNGLSLA